MVATKKNTEEEGDWQWTMVIMDDATDPVNLGINNIDLYHLTICKIVLLANYHQIHKNWHLISFGKL